VQSNLLIDRRRGDIGCVAGIIARLLDDEKSV